MSGYVLDMPVDDLASGAILALDQVAVMPVETEPELREREMSEEAAEAAAATAAEEAATKARGEVPPARRPSNGRQVPVLSGRSGALLEALRQDPMSEAPKPMGSYCPKCKGNSVGELPSDPSGGDVRHRCRNKACRYTWQGGIASPASMPRSPFTSPSGQIPTGGIYQLRGVGSTPDKTVAELLAIPKHRRGT